MPGYRGEKMPEAAVIRTVAEAARREKFFFPQGMAGFPAAKYFGLIYEGRGDVICMQSVDDLAAAFVITPWDEQRVGTPPTLSAEQSQCLRLKPGEKPLWFLVLNPFADPDWVVANRRAPIAINESERIGIQCIQQDSTLELRFQWIPQPDGPY